MPSANGSDTTTLTVTHSANIAITLHIRRTQAAKHISSVASALKYMHDRSVFHRDMKVSFRYCASRTAFAVNTSSQPENLLYAENDRIVISDFGWTVHAPGDASKRHTICGTPAYLPPEMLSGKPHDGSADAWALGVLTYELLYGFPPFDPERAPTIADNSSPSKPTPPPTLAIQAADPLTASTYQRIAAGAFAFPPTPRVSDDAKAFIASLLTVDEAERATLAAAVQHPWLSALVDSSLTKAPLSPSAHLDRAGAAKLSPPPAAVATSRGALRAARLAASSMASSPPPPPQLSSPPPPADSRAHSSTTASVSTGSSVGSSTASTGPRRIAQPGGTSSSGGPRRSAGGSSKSTSSSTGSAVADAVRSASSRMLRRAGSSSTGGGSIGSSTGSAGGARRVAVAPPSVQEKPALQPSAAANQGATTSGGGKQRLQPRERQPTTADWRKYLKQQGAPAVPSV